MASREILLGEVIYIVTSMFIVALGAIGSIASIVSLVLHLYEHRKK